LLPALILLPVLATLLALGTWQVERLVWKTALLAEISAIEAAPPRPLAADPPLFTKVSVTGRFDHGREALLELEVRGPVLGARLLTPLLRADGPPILVDRGWVPMEPASGIARPAGEVTIEAYVRLAESRGWTAPRDDAAGRRFYSFAPAAIGPALGLPAVAPFGLVALGPPGSPDPARSLPRPRNSHLGYAITWYGLAGALIAVFAGFAWRRRKEQA
jgi:surfeit locus 1 family protein